MVNGKPIIEPLHPSRRTRAAGPVARVVHERLEAAIVAGELVPGSAVSEADIAGQFAVSRTPVREALLRLAEDGLVDVVPQVGTFVGRISLAEVAEAQFIRETLEAEAVRRAAALAKADPAAADELRTRLDDQARAIRSGDLDRFYQADEELHAGVFALIGQPGVWRAMRTVKLHMDRIRRLSLPDRSTLEALLEEHRRIVDAIAAGDADAAERVLRGHARRVLDYGPAIARQHPDRFE
jgi:DNA-binding GntR family transcriptional regulator